MNNESPFTRIKNSEDIAENIIEQARKEANRILENARSENVRLRKEALEYAEQKILLHCKEIDALTEKRLRKIIEKTEKEISSLTEVKKNKIQKVVQIILSKILD